MLSSCCTTNIQHVCIASTSKNVVISVYNEHTTFLFDIPFYFRRRRDIRTHRLIHPNISESDDSDAGMNSNGSDEDGSDGEETRRVANDGGDDIQDAPELNDVLDEEDTEQLNTGYVMTPDRSRNIRREIRNLAAAVDEDTVDEDEESPASDPSDQAGMGPDLSLNDMMNDVLALQVTKYGYLDTNGSIGGSSSGPARIQFEEYRDDTTGDWRRKISPCRTRLAVNGGQIYMPMMLHLLNVNQRKQNKLEELRGFPMLMVRTLLTRSGSVDCEKSELYAELIKMHELISVLISDCRRNVKTLATHTVRVELYFASTLQTFDSDIEFPEIDYSKIISTVQHIRLKRSWIKSLVSFNKPLLKVIEGVRTLVQPGSTRSPMLEDYSASVKTMLVLCAERVITMLNIRGFKGRVMKSLVESFSPEESGRIFWSIPIDQKEMLGDEESESTGLPFGLSPALLRLPGIDSSFISQRELRTAPNYLEQFNGQLYSSLNMPIGYFRFQARVKVILLKYCMNQSPAVQATFNYGVFCNPSYEALASLSELRRSTMLTELAKVLGDCYQTEWWYVITDRAKTLMRQGMYRPEPNFPYPGKLVQFPNTKNEFEAWMALSNQRSFLARSLAYGADIPEVTSVDQFIELAFLDSDPAAVLDPKSRWNRCISRRLMHLICSELAKVEGVAEGNVKLHFSVGVFRKRVGKHFSEERATRGDLSKTIMWKTEPTKRMYRWQHFSPILIDISDNPIPSVPRESTVSHVAAGVLPLAPASNNGSKPKDVFFRAILHRGCPKICQLNRVIIYRCIMYLEENVEQSPNESAIKAHYPRFRLGNDNTGLLHLFLDGKQISDCATALQKVMRAENCATKRDIVDGALMNKNQWPHRSESMNIDLFKYDIDVETQMKSYLNGRDFANAFIYAQKGYVTKTFLQYLMGVRMSTQRRMAQGTPTPSKDIRLIAGLPP